MIDATQDYGAILAEIFEKLSGDNGPTDAEVLIENKMTTKMIELSSRRIGGKLIRCSTPVEKMVRDVQSPRVKPHLLASKLD